MESEKKLGNRKFQYARVIHNQQATTVRQLFLRFRDNRSHVGTEGALSSNWYEWMRDWETIEIGNFGPEKREQLKSLELTKFSAKEACREHKLLPRLGEHEYDFIMSDDDYYACRAIEDEADRRRQEQKLFHAWKKEVQKENARIDNKNQISRAKIEEAIKREDREREMDSKLFAKAMSTMTQDSRDLVRAYTSSEVNIDGEFVDHYGIDQAQAEGNWIWPFKAAKMTHVTRNQVENSHIIGKRRDKERDLLKSCKHTNGKFNLWLQRYCDQRDICLEVGVELSEEEDCRYFVENLNNDIFKSLLDNWRNRRMFQTFPTTFEGLKQEVMIELEAVANDTPGVIRAVENKNLRREEASFYSSNNKQPKELPKLGKTGKQIGHQAKYEAKPTERSTGCAICGYKSHRQSDCWYRQPGKSLLENQAHAKAEKERRKKEREARVSSEARNITGQESTNTLPSTHSYFVQVDRDQLDLDQDFSVAHSYSCHQCGIRKDEIDLILDPGTETGVTSPEDAGLLTNLRRERVVLQGVTGSTEVLQVGDNPLGKTRVVNGFKKSTLVTDAEFGKDYQMVNPSRNIVLLQPWDPDSNLPTWTFIRDRDRYHDALLHCTLPRSVFLNRSSEGIESSYSFYQPKEVPITTAVSPEEEAIARVDRVHQRYNHASAQAMDRLVQTEVNKISGTNTGDILNITRDEIKLWKNKYGDYCPGCISGRMKEHNRVESSKIDEVNIGDVAADIMYITTGKPTKTSIFVSIDFKCKLIMAHPMRNDTAEEIEGAVDIIRAEYALHSHKLNRLHFDREPAMVASEREIRNKGTEMLLKAAGQHVGLIEVTIRYIKETARSTKAGIRAIYGYIPPDSWNLDLMRDSVKILNRLVKIGETKTPWELFSGRKTDLNRDIRANWGEIVLTKQRKGIASGLEPRARWSVIVGRDMNGTGVLKVYNVETKRYSHILNFRRARVPEWVIVELSKINPAVDIKIEDDDIDDIQVLHEESFDDYEPHILQNLESAVDRCDDMSAAINDHEILRENYIDNNIMYMKENEDGDTNERDVTDNMPVQPVINDELSLNKEVRDLKYLARNLEVPINGRMRDRKPPNYLTYSNCLSLMLYEQAVKLYPDHADIAFKKEIDDIEAKDVWVGRYYHDLTPNQRELIIDNMKNFVDKWHPDGSFDKYKARVLVRGDHEIITANTAAPVCRVQSVFTLINIALVNDLDLMKIDVKSAFLNTPMPNDVIHRWVLLDRTTSRYLVKKNPNKWSKFVNEKGRILVELLKLMYGYKEAAHYWYKYLFKMLEKHEFKICVKDQCVVVKRRDDLVAMFAVTVDDCFCAYSPVMKDELVKMFEDEFGKVTVECGDIINIIGMTITRDRVLRSAMIQQKNYVEKLKTSFNITRTAKTPHTGNLFDRDVKAKLLVDQLGFISLNSSCMFAANRTYPECLLSATHLSTKYYRADETDERNALRMIEYMCNDTNHCLYLRPKSTRVVSAADSSHAVHEDAKSHSGGCVGMEGYDNNHAYYIFVCGKQPIIAKSSCEAELIAQSTVGDYAVWLNDFLDELGYKSTEPIIMYQDNTSAIRIGSQGTGTFKRSKHIKVRYFWLKELVEMGELLFIYLSSSEMVADILTKPLTGNVFTYLLAKLLGYNARPK